MYKIIYMSDLHIDMTKGEKFVFPFFPILEEEPDVIVFAGDISNSAIKTYEFFEEILEVFKHHHNGLMPKILFVPGNHDYYTQPIEIADELFHDLERRYSGAFYFMVAERKPVIIDYGLYPVAFIGDTLWTDFNVYGYAEMYNQMNSAGNGMSDYRFIWTDFYGGTRWTPKLSQEEHRMAVSDLVDSVLELKENMATATIVAISHMAPSIHSINPEYSSGLYANLNGAYASRLLDTSSDSYTPVLAENVDLWIHGHMHDTLDYQLERTRVVTNPRGYSIAPTVNENADFTFYKVITI